MKGSADVHLELKNAGFGYQSLLVQGASAQLRLGELCLIVGSNGVGKTTILKTLLGQIPLMEGAIDLLGTPLHQYSVKELARHISVVFSSSPRESSLTVRDLIALGRFIHYPFYFSLTSKDQLYVQEIITQLQLEPYAHLTLEKLSDGNLQKAYIGRALAQNTQLILLDEPTTHLDEANKIMILNLLRKLSREENKLVLFSSHDWRLAKEFSDTMMLVDQGALLYGLTEDVLYARTQLLEPILFDVSSSFVAPRILAPAIFKELLYSTLQKHVEKDLSTFQFTWNEPFWEVEGESMHRKFTSFEEIVAFLNNSL